MLNNPRHTIIVMLFLLSSLWGQHFGGGPNSFYQISFTPRETALGGTGVASSSGVFAPYWNPSGIANNHTGIKANSFTMGLVSRSNFMKPITYYRHDITSHNYDLIGFSFLYKPKRLLQYPHLALSVLNKSYNGLERTSLNIVNEIVKTGEFSVSQSLIMVTGAYKTKYDLTWGINARAVHFDYPGVRYPLHFAGIDAGVLIDFLDQLSWLNLDPQKVNRLINSLDLGGMFTLNRDSRNLDLQYSFGFSCYTNPLLSQHLTFRLNTDAIGGTFMNRLYKLGLEIGWEDFHGTDTFIRGGLNSRMNTFMGIGLIVPVSNFILNIDLSYTLFIPGIEGNEYLFLVDDPLKLGLVITFNNPTK